MSIVKTIITAGLLSSALMTAPLASAAPTAEQAAQIKTNAHITVGLNGLVCDFCSIALNKTFKKHASVKATYVDLDTKSLSVVLKDGESLDDAEVTKLVKKAGYSITEITRKAG